MEIEKKIKDINPTYIVKKEWETPKIVVLEINNTKGGEDGQSDYYGGLTS